MTSGGVGYPTQVLGGFNVHDDGPRECSEDVSQYWTVTCVSDECAAPHEPTLLWERGRHDGERSPTAV